MNSRRRSMSFHPARFATEKAVSRTALPCVFYPGIAGMHMTKKTYFEKLKDPRWQRKRLEALEASEWKCQICYDEESTLHVHHKQYFKEREPWEYDIDQLAVLCESCHEVQHEEEDILQLVASKAPLDGPADRHECAYILAGLLGIDVPVSFVGQLRALSLGKLLCYAPFGDAAQCRRLQEDADRGHDSEIVAAIRRVMGDRDPSKGFSLE